MTSENPYSKKTLLAEDECASITLRFTYFKPLSGQRTGKLEVRAVESSIPIEENRDRNMTTVWDNRTSPEERIGSYLQRYMFDLADWILEPWTDEAERQHLALGPRRDDGRPALVEDEVTAPIDISSDIGQRFPQGALRSRYPLLIHPDHVGSGQPLDPVEARACRCIRAGELAVRLPFAEVERIAALAGADPEDALYTLAETLDPFCLQIPGVWIGSVAVDCDPALMHVVESTVALALVKTSAEFVAWCEAWLLVHAWVCEGDEP